jgi:hypothetical protein
VTGSGEYLSWVQSALNLSYFFQRKGRAIKVKKMGWATFWAIFGGHWATFTREHQVTLS